MEFSERKRSRKSQSFKLVNEDFEAGYLDCNTSADINGEANNTAAATVWLGDKDVEIKNQITGMMRLLNDKAGRVYQRVGKEGENLKQEPQEVDLRWDQHIAISPSASQEEPQHSTWNEEPAARPQVSGQYGTRSKTLKMINKMKNTVKTNGEIPITNNPAGPNCCMCNCKTTMQAILQELRAMRKLMQTQKGAQSKQRAQTNVSAQRSTMPRKRNRKKKPAQKVAAPAAHCKKLCSQPGSTTEQSGKRDRPARERLGPTQPTPASAIDIHVPEYCLIREMPSSEHEVQLAEGYEVYIPKTQLDSILVNYTRSGSLLFRKLVCAFFDDTTLANSLPNGKRKRGLNDNRKGLDQNIVGAIKVFTEKYCTANRIDKLPGPRDWVQILQDQIKLARRRLKRGTGAEAIDYDKNVDRSPVSQTEAIVCSEERDGCSAPQSGRAFEKSTDHVWGDADKDCTA